MTRIPAVQVRIVVETTSSVLIRNHKTMESHFKSYEIVILKSTDLNHNKKNNACLGSKLII